MIIEAFLRWTERAPAADRAKAAGSLARAYLQGKLPPSDRHAAEAALTFLLDDPSPKVRVALASEMGTSTETPRTIVHALCRDQAEVAGHVVARSPVLSDADLVDLVAEGMPEIQLLVASRRHLSAAVCAALAEVGVAEAVCEMLDNPGAAIADISIRRVLERFADDSAIRACLLERPKLPSDVRHSLVVSVSDALAALPLVRGTVGEARVGRVARDACQQATLHLARNIDRREMPALVEHLRMQGHLTQALLMHLLCTGNVDFFASAIVSLSGQAASRVRGIIIDGREAAMRALYRSASIDPALVHLFVSATLLWRKASKDGTITTTGDVADRLMAIHAYEADHDTVVADLLMLVEKLNLAYRRDVARNEARAMAARAA